MVTPTPQWNSVSLPIWGLAPKSCWSFGSIGRLVALLDLWSRLWRLTRGPNDNEAWIHCIICLQQRSWYQNCIKNGYFVRIMQMWPEIWSRDLQSWSRGFWILMNLESSSWQPCKYPDFWCIPSNYSSSSPSMVCIREAFPSVTVPCFHFIASPGCRPSMVVRSWSCFGYSSATSRGFAPPRKACRFCTGIPMCEDTPYFDSR